MTDKNIAKKEKAVELLKEMDIYAPYISLRNCFVISHIFITSLIL